MQPSGQIRRQILDYSAKLQFMFTEWLRWEKDCFYGKWSIVKNQFQLLTLFLFRTDFCSIAQIPKTTRQTVKQPITKYTIKCTSSVTILWINTLRSTQSTTNCNATAFKYAIVFCKIDKQETFCLLLPVKTASQTEDGNVWLLWQEVE